MAEDFLFVENFVAFCFAIAYLCVSGEKDIPPIDTDGQLAEDRSFGNNRTDENSQAGLRRSSSFIFSVQKRIFDLHGKLESNLFSMLSPACPFHRFASNLSPAWSDS
jgi:hypothetical protein